MPSEESSAANKSIVETTVRHMAKMMQMVWQANEPPAFGEQTIKGEKIEATDEWKKRYATTEAGRGEITKHRAPFRHGDCKPGKIPTVDSKLGVYGMEGVLADDMAEVVLQASRADLLPLANEVKPLVRKWADDGFRRLFIEGAGEWWETDGIINWQYEAGAIVEKLRVIERGLLAPASKRIAVDLSRDVVILDRDEFAVTPEQAVIMSKLIDAMPGWVPSKRMKSSPTSGDRPDRIIGNLPATIRAVVEGKPGAGYRIVLPVE